MSMINQYVHPNREKKRDPQYTLYCESTCNKIFQTLLRMKIHDHLKSQEKYVSKIVKQNGKVYGNYTTKYGAHNE